MFDGPGHRAFDCLLALSQTPWWAWSNHVGQTLAADGVGIVERARLSTPKLPTRAWATPNLTDRGGEIKGQNKPPYTCTGVPVTSMHSLRSSMCRCAPDTRASLDLVAPPCPRDIPIHGLGDTANASRHPVAQPVPDAASIGDGINRMNRGSKQPQECFHRWKHAGRQGAVKHINECILRTIQIGDVGVWQHRGC